MILITRQEAARRGGVSVDTIDRLLSKGVLTKRQREGIRGTYIEESEFESWRCGYQRP